MNFFSVSFNSLLLIELIWSKTILKKTMSTLNEAKSYTQVLLRITRKQSEPPRIVAGPGEVRGPRPLQTTWVRAFSDFSVRYSTNWITQNAIYQVQVWQGSCKLVRPAMRVIGALNARVDTPRFKPFILPLYHVPMRHPSGNNDSFFRIQKVSWLTGYPR